MAYNKIATRTEYTAASGIFVFKMMIIPVLVAIIFEFDKNANSTKW